MLVVWWILVGPRRLRNCWRIWKFLSQVPSLPFLYPRLFNHLEVLTVDLVVFLRSLQSLNQTVPFLITSHSSLILFTKLNLIQSSLSPLTYFFVSCVFLANHLISVYLFNLVNLLASLWTQLLELYYLGKRLRYGILR